MSEGDRRSFGEGLIALGNLAVGAGVLTQLLPARDTIFSPLGLIFAASTFLLCYWAAYKIFKVKGGDGRE